MSNFPNASSPERLRVEAWFTDNPKQKIGAPELADRLGIDQAQIKNILSRMRDRGIVCARKVGNRNHYWSGTYAEEYADERAALNLTPSRLFVNGSQAGQYMGEELRRNPGIPAERYAAFDLPSLVSGKRVPPLRLTAGCTSSIPFVSRKDKCL